MCSGVEVQHRRIPGLVEEREDAASLVLRVSDEMFVAHFKEALWRQALAEYLRRANVACPFAPRGTGG